MIKQKPYCLENHHDYISCQWKVDSAGHGKWHLGEKPEPRTLQVLEEHGIKGYTHIARMVSVLSVELFAELLDPLQQLILLSHWN